MKSFDDLFNDFFNEQPNESKNTSSIHEEIRKLMEALSGFKKTEALDAEEMIANKLGINLGEPTTSEEIIEDGLRFTKLTWDTPNGRFVKIVVTDVLAGESKVEDKKTLDEQLQEAVDNEDYELAIKLRDKINNLKEMVSEAKKKNP